MPTYLHHCSACDQKFEEIYSITAPVLTVCSLCKKEGGVKRLINFGFGIKVELGQQEYREYLEREATKFKNEVASDENKLANMHGEDRYNGLSQQNMQVRKTLEEIGRDKKTLFRRKS